MIIASKKKKKKKKKKTMTKNTLLYPQPQKTKTNNPHFQCNSGRQKAQGQYFKNRGNPEPFQNIHPLSDFRHDFASWARGELFLFHSVVFCVLQIKTVIGVFFFDREKIQEKWRIRLEFSLFP
jgi:hypothetical protein